MRRQTRSGSWYPLGKRRPIVLDPEISFGAPTIKGTGIRTDTMIAMAQAGQDVDTVAWWYDIEPFEVEAALEFETAIAA